MAEDYEFWKKRAEASRREAQRWCDAFWKQNDARELAEARAQAAEFGLERLSKKLETIDQQATRLRKRIELAQDVFRSVADEHPDHRDAPGLRKIADALEVG
jgi:hypothetical protein